MYPVKSIQYSFAEQSRVRVRAVSISRINRWTVFVATFILAAFPYARISVGALPVYIYDIVIIIGLYTVIRKTGLPSGRFGAMLMVYTMAYLCFLLLSQVKEAFDIGFPVDSAYYGIRYSIASLSGIFFFVSFRSEVLRRFILSGLAIGMVVNAVVAIAYSLPGFGWLRLFLLESSFLFPGRTFTALDENGLAEIAMRARTFVGGPNVVAGWIVCCLPLAAYYFYSNNRSNTRYLSVMVVIFGLLGSLFTYSRTAYIGMVLIIAYSLFSRSGKFGRVVVSAIVVLVMAWGARPDISSNSTMFDFVIGKFEGIASSDRSYSDEARVATYTKVIPFLIDNPEWIFFGSGLGAQKTASKNNIKNQFNVLKFESSETHAVWAANIYFIGLCGSIVVTLMLLTLYIAFFVTMGRVNHDIILFFRMILIGIVPFYMFTHFFSDKVSGVALLFAIAGMGYSISGTYSLAANK